MTDFYEIKVPAPADPVSFDKASEWCRDISSVDTALVEALISAATEECERITNRVFSTRTFTGKFSSTSSSKYEQNEFVELRRSPLVSVSSVKVNDVELTVDVDYIIKKSSSFARILFLTSVSPDSDSAYPIEVEFIAGYGFQTASTVATLSRVGSLVTVVTDAAHKFVSGIFPLIAGVAETGYNGKFEATVIDSTSFSYVVAGTPTTPGTGTITAQWVIPGWVTTVIQQIVLFWYENRGDVSTDKKQRLPFVAIPILRQHKIINTYG